LKTNQHMQGLKAR